MHRGSKQSDPTTCALVGARSVPRVCFGPSHCISLIHTGRKRGPNAPQGEISVQEINVSARHDTCIGQSTKDGRIRWLR
jgi:hypothetical protein